MVIDIHNMLPPPKPLFKAAGVLLLIDLFWIATGGIYARSIAERIQGDALEIRYLPAVITYLFLAYMLLETQSYKQAFMYGICIYGVYDFTTMALFKGYDWKFALADTLWGGILFMFARYLLKAF
jgi:uncharacterized membrane protein